MIHNQIPSQRSNRISNSLPEGNKVSLLESYTRIQLHIWQFNYAIVKLFIKHSFIMSVMIQGGVIESLLKSIDLIFKLPHTHAYIKVTDYKVEFF